MKSDYDKLESIFVQALQYESQAEREAYIEQTCDGDSILRNDVLALVKGHLQTGGFLDTPVICGSTPSSTCSSDQLPIEAGHRIGPYRLKEKTGEGGFGIVYRAEQEQPLKRLVALKLLKPGMDSSQVVARFEHERQALALMDHPNIARVLDAGTTESGRPYFVMEFVDGSPICRYCDFYQLSLHERLRLFSLVCQAVHYSHLKGIIHRDLKSSNILVSHVDGQPVLKVIDFGIAKALGQKLTDCTMLTQAGGFLGTLESMSPEQAQLNAVDIDARADIYSLGILLFELLTGTTPLTRAQVASTPLDTVLRMIREVESPLPSTRLKEQTDTLTTAAEKRCTDTVRLGKMVKGELDWITAKCLEKDRTRRYDSASALGRDIERYLNHEAIDAGPPSKLYRLRKFSRKHWRSLVAVTLLIGLTLATAITMTSAYMLVSHERHEKELALRAEKERRRETRHALDAMTSLVIEDWLTRQPVMQPEHKSFLNQAIQDYKQFALDTDQDQEALVGAADASRRVGTMFEMLGQTEDAESAWQQALNAYTQLAQRYPDQAEYQLNRGSLCAALSGIYIKTQRLEKSEEFRKENLAIHEQLLRTDPDNREFRDGQARAMTRLGLLYKNTSRLPEAIELYKQARAILVQLVREQPDEWVYRENLGQALLNYGVALEVQENFPESENIQREGVEAFERVCAAVPDQPKHLESLSICLNNLGIVLRAQEKNDEAECILRCSLAIKYQLARDYPAVPEYSRGVAMTLNNLGILLKNIHKMPEAIECYREALQVHQKLADRYPSNTDHQSEVGGSLVNLARTHLLANDPHTARQLLEQGEHYHLVALESNPDHPVYRRFYRLNRWRLTEALLELKDHQTASKVNEQFLATAMELPRDAITCAGMWSHCAELAHSDSQLPEEKRTQLASEYTRKAIQTLKQAIAEHPKLTPDTLQDQAFAPIQSLPEFQVLVKQCSGNKGSSD